MYPSTLLFIFYWILYKVNAFADLLVLLFQIAGDDKSHSRRCQPSGEVSNDAEKAIVAVSPGKVAEKVTGTVLSPSMTTLEMRNPASAHMKAGPTNGSPLSPALPNEAWLQVYSTSIR